MKQRQSWRPVFATALVCLVIALSLVVAPLAKAAQAVPSEADKWSVANTLPDYAELGAQTFNGLGKSPTDGEIESIPGDLLDELGYDPGKRWRAGTPIADVLTLGDIGQSFYGQAFTFADIAGLTGLDARTVSLSDYTLLENQTLSSISAIAGLDDVKLGAVAPLQAMFNHAVRPGLQEIAQQTGDLAFGDIEVATYIDQALAEYGEMPIGRLIQLPDLLSDLSFGDIAFQDAPLDILESYSIADIPGLDQAQFGEFIGWQDVSISDIPGLADVPFGNFPNPIAAISGGFGGTHDVTYGSKEHRVTETKYSITGSDQEGFNVQCAQAKGCMYLELAGPGAMHGAQWIAGGRGQGQQMVKGGRGLLAVVNGGKEPTGRVPFGAAFKVVLTQVNESSGTGNFAIYTRYCQRTWFVDLGCTPYFMGPIPVWGTQEKGFVLTGPLDGRGGASGGIQVPPELETFSTQPVGGGTYYGRGAGTAMSMDDHCLDSLIGSLRHSSEATGARAHIPRIIAAANEAGITDKAQVAYILATVSTELEGGWRPTGERGVGCGTYGSGCFYGRGFAQLTWEENYRKMGRILGVDLVNNPELANDPDLAAKITVIGMRDGIFTGVRLSDYIGGGQADFRGARKIVNDLDKASYTAQQAERFLQALNRCSTLKTQSGVPAGEINGAIMDSIRRNRGMSSAGIPGTKGGELACAATVNAILSDAGIAPLGGGPPYGSLAVAGVENALRNGRGVSVSEAEAQPGDLNIIDMGGKRHIGICLNAGCTRVISNSSSRASFSWESDGWFTPSYGGGRRAIYRVKH